MAKKVLTVDDSKTLRMIVARYLKPFGVDIVEAENGSIGLNKARAEKPDLVLLDYNMPVMDGYQTLEALKADPVLKSLPVIMLTTETVKETVVKLIKLGLKDFIAKPFSREALLTKVNPVLGLFSGDSVPEIEAAVQASSLDPTKRTIFAVDDKENVLKLLKDFLSGGFNVLTASKGQEALSMIPANAFDVLLLDIDLPDVNGLDVYKQMKNTLEAKHVRVAGMALRTDQQDISNAKQAGIRDFLYKPFTKSDLDVLIAGLGSSSPGNVGEATRNRFLVPEGSIRILAFPEENDPQLKPFSNALGHEIPAELKDMADEGNTQLIIRLTPSVIADLSMVKKFLALLELVEKLALSVRLVAENDRTRQRLQQFSETSKVQTFDSLDQAIKSFA